ncbi:MAG: dTDP-4-dehydrorhamnose 3,5-epimerase [Alphaproteobacteria bacterium]|nr:dTDP-4-dehydrorhamnose 3,5-epimerase [Alphaproteobacteria bacterium]
MKFTKTHIESLIIIEPKIFRDSRGYFFESYNYKEFGKNGIPNVFVQDNQSYSTHGTIRGLHFQKGKYAQAKLVRVIKGTVLDVAVDLRPDSPTYGQYITAELSAEKKNMLFIPRGFAHGFSVLSGEATLFYKCDNFYNPRADGGIRFDDPILNINWRIPENLTIVSNKDRNLPYLDSKIFQKGR